MKINTFSLQSLGRDVSIGHNVHVCLRVITVRFPQTAFNAALFSYIYGGLPFFLKFTKNVV